MKISHSEIREILKPFATTKIHNPNRSFKPHTTRVMSVKAIDIARLKHLYDHLLLEELDLPPQHLEEPLPTLLRMAAKEVGGDPADILCRIEEQLTHRQYETCSGFLAWVHDNGLAYGHNIQEVYRAYLANEPGPIRDRLRELEEIINQGEAVTGRGK